ncbi:hypothetical protein F443_20570 [Phytophthora nicotianae P1569]|uniref:Uncharacterized protein n=1 Tax=Phytophthora nicotianae P1569 TaxID=1317065 RepID=V9E297_PHYNI|nr:hypothetical protein F443_20570 [Phytophthora nicotianae P1569]
MDFTHGTTIWGINWRRSSNLVPNVKTWFSYFIARSLVLTSVTGRGFPVLDFIWLDQQTMTISTILIYFKEKNPG